MAPEFSNEGSQLRITQTPAPCSSMMSSMYCTQSIKVEYTYANADEESVSHTVTIDQSQVSKLFKAFTINLRNPQSLYSLSEKQQSFSMIHLHKPLPKVVL